MSLARSLGLILVADDDPNDLFLLRRRFGKAGIKNPVIYFRDGEELVGFLRPMTVPPNQGLRPIAIFLDIKMPRLDGFEVLRWIRRQRALKDVPVVILAGAGEPRDVRRATEFGATRYMMKHPPADEFARLMSELCGAAD